MWNALTEGDKHAIQELYDYFIPKFPAIKSEVIKDRIFNGYCWGEGCLCHITTIEDWNNVFFGSGLQKGLLTCFDGWDDYFNYNGDFHKKIKFSKTKQSQ